MFGTIDKCLLSYFEKGVTHPLQRLTGKTNYYFVGLSCFLIVLVMLGAYFNIFPDGFLGKDGFVLDIMHGSPVFYWMMIFIFAVCTQFWKCFENDVYIRINNGLANPRKIDLGWRYNRLAMLFITSCFILLSFTRKMEGIGRYDILFLILFLFLCWLISVDPLPPCTGKVKEWLANFGKRQVLTPIKIEENK